MRSLIHTTDLLNGMAVVGIVASVATRRARAVLYAIPIVPLLGVMSFLEAVHRRTMWSWSCRWAHRCERAIDWILPTAHND